MARALAHVIGFDDAPFATDYRGDVLIVGALYSGLRLEAVITGAVRRDGANSTDTLVRLVSTSRYRGHLQLVLLQGIALAGFNVIDLQRLHEMLHLPVMVVTRRQPDMVAIKRALLHKVPGGARKWRLIERAGTMERIGRVHVQRAGLTLADACRVIERFALVSAVPEPLRVAHLIAGGLALGESRHRP